MVFRRGFGRPFRERKMYTGSWKCSDCGKEITELPFQPAEGRPIYCKECWSKRRGFG